MNKLLSVLTLSMLLFSCAEVPTPTVNYYLLNTPIPTKNSDQLPQKLAKTTQEKQLIIDDIVLPQYLKQPSLVMLVATNQLHYAHYDVWGESLEQGIHKTLTLLLNKLFEQPQLSRQKVNKQFLLTKDSIDKKIHLTVVIDHFYPTDQGDVILSGHYWFTNQSVNVNKKLYKKEVLKFYFKQSITANGYSQAVTQMHDLLEQLANNINQQALVFFTPLSAEKNKD